MRSFAVLGGTVLSATLLVSAGAAPSFHYPATPPIPVTDTYFGSMVVDPYRWLENGADAKVKTWAAAQNAITLSYLESRTAYAPIAQRVKTLAKTGTTRFGLTIAGDFDGDGR